MLNELVLGQGFGQEIRRLLLCIDLVYGDSAHFDMSPEEMPLDVDMFGPGSKLWNARKFDGSAVILKDLAVDTRWTNVNRSSMAVHFLDQIHHGKNRAHGFRYGNKFALRRRESDLSLQLRGPIDRAAGICDDITCARPSSVRVGRYISRICLCFKFGIKNNRQQRLAPFATCKFNRRSIVVFITNGAIVGFFLLRLF